MVIWLFHLSVSRRERSRLQTDNISNRLQVEGRSYNFSWRIQGFFLLVVAIELTRWRYKMDYHNWHWFTESFWRSVLLHTLWLYIVTGGLITQLRVRMRGEACSDFRIRWHNGRSRCRQQMAVSCYQCCGWVTLSPRLVHPLRRLWEFSGPSSRCHLNGRVDDLQTAEILVSFGFGWARFSSW